MLLKELVHAEFLDRLGGALRRETPAFDAVAFRQTVLGPGWEALELKARIRRTAEVLYAHLALPFPDAAEVLVRVSERLYAELNPNPYGLQLVCLSEVGEIYGRAHPEAAFRLFEWSTRVGTAEFAVRPFLLADPAGSLARLERFARHEDQHVRRLASEGSRPRLPWGMALKPFQRDPSPTLPILERLKTDPSDYVRRSVANHLNDIAKDHPELALDLAERWLGTHPHTDALVRHAMRVLIKRAHPRALALFGWRPEAAVREARIAIHPQAPRIGASARIAFGFVLDTAAPVRADYVVGYRKADGSIREKVFVGVERHLEAGSHRFERTHSFREMTTRKHHAGTHTLELMVNGMRVARAGFELTD